MEDQEKKQLLAMEEKLKWLEEQHKQGRIPQSIYEAQVQELLKPLGIRILSSFLILPLLKYY